MNNTRCHVTKRQIFFDNVIYQKREICVARLPALALPLGDLSKRFFPKSYTHDTGITHRDMLISVHKAELVTDWQLKDAL